MTVLAWLAELGLERHAPAFAAAEVDLASLPLLTDDDLKEMGLPLGPRRRILAAVGDMGATASPRTGAAPGDANASSPERRHLTVMFADLADSTQLSTRIDPEAMSGLLQSYKAMAATEVVHSAGRVAKYLGDGVLAYFGWPQAREDAAERAIHCGLALIERVKTLRTPDGKALSCRIGVATGLVVVGGVTGAGTAQEDTIAGEVLNLAARLQGLAEPDSIVMSDSTRRLVGQLFDCDDLGEHELKGFEGPVKAWRPARETLHTHRFNTARAIRAPLVGREQELGLLADRWAKACGGGGRAVLILGEAGMGKSRLVQALHTRIVDTPHSFVAWQCSAFHSGKALYPVIEQIKSAADIADADPPQVRLEKLQALLTPDATSAPPPDALPLFAELLAIPAEAGYAPLELTPAQRRAATIDALVDWVGRIAAAKPLLLLVEDAHWIDATTLDVVSRLVGSIGRLPVVALVTSRPGFSPSWAGGAQASVIGLDRLSDAEAEALVRSLAEQSAPTDRMISQVIAKSDGNPLFLEELSLAALQALPSSKQAVPDTLQSSLMARLDQLGEAKKVAQTCSVLGRRFALPLLSRVSDLDAEALDDRLAALVAADILYPVGRAQDARFEFKHALVRDAAYGSLLFSQRRDLHERCARALERDFEDVTANEPELLAHHFAEANLPMEAGRYAERAGDRAAAAVSFAEASAGYAEALDLLARTPLDEERDRRELALLLKLGPARVIMNGPQSPDVRSVYTRAEALAQSLEAADSQFQAVWGLWINANIGRDLDVAAGRAQQLMELSARSDNDGHQLEALHCRWSSAWFRGEYARARDDAGQGVQLYDRERHHGLHVNFGGHDPGVCACSCRGGALAAMGRFTASGDSLAEGIALAEALNHPHSIGHALMNASIACAIARDREAVEARAGRLHALATRYNFPPVRSLASYLLRWAQVEAGVQGGLAHMRAEFVSTLAIAPFPLLNAGLLAEQLIRNGDVEHALAVLDQALGILRPRNVGLYLPELHRLRGECLMRLGDPTSAAEQFDRARDAAKRQSSPLFEVRALASALRLAGRGEAEAEPLRSDLRHALAGIDEDRTRPDRAEAEALLA